MRILSVLLLLIALLALSGTAHAAESYANCTGVVAAPKTTITTSGTWCLKQNLSMATPSGNAIKIAADNVTLDCNDFVLAGTGGSATTAIGIYVLNNLNTTIRHCNVQGFRIGVFLDYSNGQNTVPGDLVEDNIMTGNWWIGLSVNGEGTVVRRNQIFNTGGTTNEQNAFGIRGYGAVNFLDNTISGVSVRAGSNGDAYGLYDTIFGGVNGTASIDLNRVSGLAKDGTGKDYGIFASGSGQRLVLWKNDVFGDGSAGSVGLKCGNSVARAKENVVSGFATAIGLCGKGTGNDVSP